MTRKTDILNLVESELKRIDWTTDSRTGIPRSPYTYKSNVFDNVFKDFKFLDEINDFPTITFVTSNESRNHIGDGTKFGDISILIRAYIKTENALDAADDLIEDIEFVLNGIPNASGACASEIQELIVNSVNTDEGLFEPYGIAELTATITYLV